MMHDGQPTDVMNIRNVSKKFPPNIVALEHASLSVRSGEVHCLLGANGAGKSTLLKIIAGALLPTTGEILIDGELVAPHSPSDAASLGISMIYQELDLVPQLTVEQNMFWGMRRAVLACSTKPRGAGAPGRP